MRTLLLGKLGKLGALAAIVGLAASFGRAGSDDALRDRVASARGLDFREPVAVVRLEADAFGPRVAALIDEEFTDDQARVFVEVLGTLEMLPVGYPFEDALADELAPGAAAIYDPHRGEILLPATQRGAAAGREIAHLHELAHALADQHFDLSRFDDDPALRWRLDAQLAFRSLAEGDAVLASLIASGLTDRDSIENAARNVIESLGGLSMASRGDGELPPILVAHIYEPYSLGLELVLDTWLLGGWDGVNELWDAPPRSTEQLLHPDRRDDAPRPPNEPAVVRDGVHLGSLELGELGVRLWLAQRLAPQEAERAAAGWDGDRADVFALPGGEGANDEDGVKRERTRVVWRTVWDGDAEAREFARAAERWLWDGSGNGTEWSLRRRGDLVIVTLTPPMRETVVLDEDPWTGVEFTGDS